MRFLILLFLCLPLVAQVYKVDVSKTNATSETIAVQLPAIPETRGVKGIRMWIKCSQPYTVKVNRNTAPATGTTAVTPVGGPDTANAAKFQVFSGANSTLGAAMNGTDGDSLPAGGFIWDNTNIAITQPRSGITITITLEVEGTIEFRSAWEQI